METKNIKSEFYQRRMQTAKKRNVNTLGFISFWVSARANLSTRYEIVHFMIDCVWLRTNIIHIWDILTFHFDVPETWGMEDENRIEMRGGSWAYPWAKAFSKFSKSPICCNVTRIARSGIEYSEDVAVLLVHVLANVMQRNINGHQFWHLVPCSITRHQNYLPWYYLVADVVTMLSSRYRYCSRGGGWPNTSWSLISFCLRGNLLL